MSKRPGDPGYAPGWCIHYRYNRDPKTEAEDTCEAGVSYASFKPKTFQERPCFLTEKGESRLGALECTHLRRPTQEEIAAHNAWASERQKVLFTAIGRCLEQAHGQRGIGGIVECPACKGKLHYSIAQVNGHVHGRCETPNCLSWTQ